MFNDWKFRCSYGYIGSQSWETVKPCTWTFRNRKFVRDNEDCCISHPRENFRFAWPSFSESSGVEQQKEANKGYILLLTQGLATLCYLSSFETLRALFPSIQADELDATLLLHVHSDRVTECIRYHDLNMVGYGCLARLDLSIVFDQQNMQFQLVSVPFVQPDHNIDTTK